MSDQLFFIGGNLLGSTMAIGCMWVIYWITWQMIEETWTDWRIRGGWYRLAGIAATVWVALIFTMIGVAFALWVYERGGFVG